MDFLTTLSVRYADKAYTEDFTSDDEGEKGLDILALDNLLLMTTRW